MTSTATAPVEIHPDWLDNPIVRIAMARTDGGPADVLRALSGLLNDLEDRLPGVPFAEILATAKVGEDAPEVRARVARAMIEAGTGTAEVADLVGETAWSVAHTVAEADQRRENGAQVQALLDTGMSVRAIGRELGVAPATVIRRLRSAGGEAPDRTPTWVKVGSFCLENGYKAAVAEFGVTKQYAMHARKRVREELAGK